VTVVHSKTPNPAEVTRNADIVIAAVGVPELVRGDWLKPGAVVIDVGINPVEVCCISFSLTVYRSLIRNLNSHGVWQYIPTICHRSLIAGIPVMGETCMCVIAKSYHLS
jgi:hypothetical protein